MSVLFDATILIDLFDHRVTGDRRLRLDGLIADLQRSHTKVLIPTPALTELLVNADKARDAYVQRLTSESTFAMAPFDNRAAIECALLLGEAFSKKKKVRSRKPNSNLIGKLSLLPRLAT